MSLKLILALCKTNERKCERTYGIGNKNCPHTNVITLNGNRLDNNGSIVKQIIVVLLTNKAHRGHKAQGEERENKISCKPRIGRASLFNTATMIEHVQKHFVRIYSQQEQKIGFLCHSSSTALLLPKCLQNCLKIETFAVVYTHMNRINFTLNKSWQWKWTSANNWMVIFFGTWKCWC